MKASLYLYSADIWESHTPNSTSDCNTTQLVLCFGEKEKLKDKNIFPSLKKQFPIADIAICSTAGEIYNGTVLNDSVIAVALQFDNTITRSASVNIRNFKNSNDAAVNLAEKIPKENLSYIMIFSDGSIVNGSELVKGISTVAGENILVTGGLAGDGSDFKSTLVGLNATPKEGEIVAIGFYGQNLKVTHASQGGWDEFGLEKKITKSVGNVLYEIDDENALDLYKKYLGKESENLPGSALLFPLAVTIPESSSPIVRSILSIDNERKTMTFAGDVPKGSTLRFMKANFNKITEAAGRAAHQTLLKDAGNPEFALLVSCVGRKLILGSQIDEEVEAVNNIFGNETILAGFYSYGEISPFNKGGNCQLHNQTMTITSFYELP